MALAEEKKEEVKKVEDPKNEKRSLLGLGYGYGDLGHSLGGYSTGHGLGGYSAGHSLGGYALGGYSGGYGLGGYSLGGYGLGGYAHEGVVKAVTIHKEASIILQRTVQIL